VGIIQVINENISEVICHHCETFSLSLSLAQHIHPSAQMFTQNILEGSEIKYSGDPLADFMLVRFFSLLMFDFE